MQKHSTSLFKKITLASLAVVFAITSFSTTFTQVSAKRILSEYQQRVYDKSIEYFDVEEYCIPGKSHGGNGFISVDLSKNIPREWGEIFSAAGEKFGVNPNFLAAIYLTENGNTWYDVSKRDWPTSSAGAMGVMQFIPSTWKSHAQDGDGDEKKDPNNAWDAIFAAADYSNDMVGVSEIGDNKNVQPKTFVYGAIAYNAGGANAKEFINANISTNDTSEAYRYGNNVYALLTSDFTKSGTSHYSDPIPASGSSSDSGSSIDISTPTKEGIYILGDSITEVTADTYKTKLKDKFKKVEVNGLDGRKISGGPSPDGLAALDADKDKYEDFGTVVIALGTTGGTDETTIKQVIDKLKEVGFDGKIYWVDTAVYDKTDLIDIVQNANKAIYENKNLGYEVLSWAKTIDSNVDPENGMAKLTDKNEYIDNSSGILPTAEGVEALANMIESGINITPSSDPVCDTEVIVNDGDVQSLWNVVKDYSCYGDDAPGGWFANTACKKATGTDLNNCSKWVSFALKTAGWDSEVPASTAQMAGSGGENGGGYFANSDKWSYVGYYNMSNPGDISKYQPGDVFVTNGHTFLFVGNIPGFTTAPGAGKQANASEASAPVGGQSSYPTAHILGGIPTAGSGHSGYDVWRMNK